MYCTSCTAHKNHIIRGMNASAFWEHSIVFQSMDWVKRYHGLWFLKEHCNLFVLHNFGEQFIPFKLGKLKLLWRGKKGKAKSVHKAVTRGCKLRIWKEQLKEWFELMSHTFTQFSHKFSISCSICSNLSFYQVILKCYFKNPCFQLQQNVLWTNEIMRVIFASTGINGVSLAHYISYTSMVTYLFF